MLIIACVVCVLVVGVVCLEVSGRFYSFTDGQAKAVDAAVLHTYMVAGPHALTVRGRLVAEAAARFCLRYGKPLIIASGFASGQVRPDQRIYQEYLCDRHPSLQTVLDDDPSIRSTHEEIRGACRVMATHGWRMAAAFALLPHLPRAMGLWRRYRTEGTITLMRGVRGPLYFHLWELAMIPLEWLLPPDSARRKRVLNVFRGKKAPRAVV